MRHLATRGFCRCKRLFFSTVAVHCNSTSSLNTSPLAQGNMGAFWQSEGPDFSLVRKIIFFNGLSCNSIGCSLLQCTQTLVRWVTAGGSFCRPALLWSAGSAQPNNQSLPVHVANCMYCKAPQIWWLGRGTVFVVHSLFMTLCKSNCSLLGIQVANSLYTHALFMFAWGIAKSWSSDARQLKPHSFRTSIVESGNYFQLWGNNFLDFFSVFHFVEWIFDMLSVIVTLCTHKSKRVANSFHF